MYPSLELPMMASSARLLRVCLNAQGWGTLRGADVAGLVKRLCEAFNTYLLPGPTFSFAVHVHKTIRLSGFDHVDRMGGGDLLHAW